MSIGSHPQLTSAVPNITITCNTGCYNDYILEASVKKFYTFVKTLTII
jgi:hypothetical protein